MGFESDATMAAIGGALKKAVQSSSLKQALQARAEIEARAQVLAARKDKFAQQRADLAAGIAASKEKITLALREGADPSEINRQIRVMAQDIEDLDEWIVQLEKTSIPEVKKALSQAEGEVFNALKGVVGEVKPAIGDQMNTHLGHASDVWDSWRAATRKFFKEYGKEAPQDLLRIDNKRTSFYMNTGTPWG